MGLSLIEKEGEVLISHPTFLFLTKKPRYKTTKDLAHTTSTGAVVDV